MERQAINRFLIFMSALSFGCRADCRGAGRPRQETGTSAATAFTDARCRCHLDNRARTGMS